MALTKRDFEGLDREDVIAKLRHAAPALSLGERFRLIHELGVYHGAESLSGDGSSLEETSALRVELPALLSRHDIRGLIDVPCGDFHWLARVEMPGVDYLGLDIVPELVVRNLDRYASPQRRFQVHDVTRDALPKAGLVLCRDLLIHLGLTDMGRALKQIRSSGSRFLLVTHYAGCDQNTEIESGDFRPVNLCAPPFSWPRPLEVIEEHSRMADGLFPDRGMALFRLAEVPHVGE